VAARKRGRGGEHPLKWQRETERGETHRKAKEDARRTRIVWTNRKEEREKIVQGRGVGVGMKRHGENQWGEGAKLGEESMCE
jgi:hypothetical protein